MVEQQLKTIVIIGSMPVDDSLRDIAAAADILLTADAGCETAARWKLTPDYAVGDFDSTKVPDLPNVTVLPTHKNDTDTFYAVRKAVSLGAGTVKLLGCTGGRIDHAMANLQALVYLAQRGIQAYLIDKNDTVQVLLRGTVSIPKKENCYLSVLPVTSRATGVTLRGVKYPLQNAVLHHNYPIGVSNEFAAPNAEITVRTGGLYIAQCAKR